MNTITIQGLRIEVAPDGSCQYYSNHKRRWFRADTIEQMKSLLAEHQFCSHQESAWYHLNNRWYK